MKSTPFSCIFKELSHDTKHIAVGPAISKSVLSSGHIDKRDFVSCSLFFNYRTHRPIYVMFKPCSRAELVVIHPGAGRMQPGCVRPGQMHPTMVNDTHILQVIMWQNNQDGGRIRDVFTVRFCNNLSMNPFTDFFQICSESSGTFRCRKRLLTLANVC